MSRLIRSLVLALIGLTVVAGSAATPAAAGVIDYGAIAQCRYKVTQGEEFWTEALLKKIAVQPPTIAKTAGTTGVGWRFIVQRSLDRGNTPWVVTYRSPVQRASSSAGLTPMRVVVNVPADDQTPSGRDHVWYRVILKLFWYGAGGSVQNKVTHQMTDMHYVIPFDGYTDDFIDSKCDGLATQSA
jgi:hypothetical protein